MTAATGGRAASTLGCKDASATGASSAAIAIAAGHAAKLHAHSHAASPATLSDRIEGLLHVPTRAGPLACGPARSSATFTRLH
ncbi:conserved hypothethical protein [Ralstonia solanacearum PSI07]|uniref:Conserved hypothethical protein n=1 Tax=blood disease bacterium R229 TaxID=741978 RepID=G2ZQ11_9RALS|nr:conserved hypothethical protein [Ralstonia solanacearum PSI07]CCA81135.1 conserved hypothethical protein [blood disease bacterium R229]